MRCVAPWRVCNGTDIKGMFGKSITRRYVEALFF